MIEVGKSMVSGLRGRSKEDNNAIASRSEQSNITKQEKLKLDYAKMLKSASEGAGGYTAQEIEQMRADFNQQISTLHDTIIAMFETMQKTGIGVNIETPERPVERREYADNISKAFLGRYGGG